MKILGPAALLGAFEHAIHSAIELGDSYVVKPLHSREGANVEIVIGGNVIEADDGPYGDEPKILQAVAPLPVRGQLCRARLLDRRRRSVRLGLRARRFVGEHDLADFQ